MASYATIADLEPYGPSGTLSLAHERANASFGVAALEKVVMPLDERNLRNEVLSLFQTDPVFARTRGGASHEQCVRDAAAKATRLVQVCRERKWDMRHWNVGLGLLEAANPLGLNTSMFLSIIETEASEEQRRELLPKIANFNIIGCYAQTELGHGSNVQGLETVVNYVPEEDCLEVDSPNLTASKWWIGSLGKSSTHVALMARLVIRGKNYGPHNFVFRIRSEEDHSPLPGVFVGDIGPKYGQNEIDNGFCIFRKFRVPKTALLSRFSSISSDGTYKREVSSRIVYNAMMMVRAGFVRGSAFSLAKAVVIAARYSVVRRQTASADPKAIGDAVGAEWSARSGKPAETQIINYSQQSHRICTKLAQAYALLFVGKDMMRQYLEFTALLNKDPAAAQAQQPETHATSSSLKALTTDMAYSGIDDMRRACGGHGYSSFSGISNAGYGMMVKRRPWGEGDNYMIALQCTRYLLKTLSKMRAAKQTDESLATPTTRYLLDTLKPGYGQLVFPASSPEELLDVEKLVKAFAVRAGRLVSLFADEVRDGESVMDMQWEGNMVSKAHGQFVIVTCYAEQLRVLEQSLDKDAHAALRRMFFLYCLSTMESEPDFAHNGYLDRKQFGWLRKVVRKLVVDVRKDVVALTDAWGFSDYELNSALGRYDGKVYETMFQWAIEEPLNQGKNWPVADFYRTLYKPMLEDDGSRGIALSGMVPVKPRL
ncbi:hypothetical protein DFJ74DRAFT_611505 [Hyaloraphidium curvatum]|nr:hypothetical protein DFJ74DRAFT_611505 [Hyaloraphidium curvatum]